MRITLVLAVTIGCLADTAAGYCFQGPLLSEITEATKRVRQYCEYRSPDGKSTLKIFPGSKIYTTDCLECQCSQQGLGCCGFGSHAGVVGLPDDCTKLADGCQDLYVKKNDTTKNCFTGQPIDFQGMASTQHPDSYRHMEKETRSTTGKAASVTQPKIEIPKLIEIPSARTWRHMIPDLELNRLNRRRPISEILHEIMTKHVPATNPLRTVGLVGTVPLTAEPLQTNQGVTSTPPREMSNVWHAPMTLLPYYDLPHIATLLPWLLTDHI